MKAAWILPLTFLVACASTSEPANDGSSALLSTGIREANTGTSQPQARQPAPAGWQTQGRFVETAPAFSRELKLLYIEQEFRWEGRALNEVLKRQQQLAYQGLFLGAQEGWRQPVSNRPGLEQYVRPLTAAFVREEGPLRHTALFDALGYDVAIIGDVAAGGEGVNGDCWLTLENFVIDGGGLILVAGMRALPASHWDSAAFKRLAPVESTGEPEAVDTKAERWCGVTEQGRASGLFTMRPDDAGNAELWGGDSGGFKRGLLNGHLWYCDTVKAKAGASVLARSVATGQSLDNAAPLVVSMELGRGRVLWIGTDDMNRLRELVGDHYFSRFYHNAIRWAANDPGPK